MRLTLDLDHLQALDKTPDGQSCSLSLERLGLEGFLNASVSSRYRHSNVSVSSCLETLTSWSLFCVFHTVARVYQDCSSATVLLQE